MIDSGWPVTSDSDEIDFNILLIPTSSEAVITEQLKLEENFLKSEPQIKLKHSYSAKNIKPLTDNFVSTLQNIEWDNKWCWSDPPD